MGCHIRKCTLAIISESNFHEYQAVPTQAKYADFKENEHWSQRMDLISALSFGWFRILNFA